MSSPASKSYRLNVRLKRSEMDKAAEVADGLGITVSEMVRTLFDLVGVEGDPHVYAALQQATR